MINTSVRTSSFSVDLFSLVIRRNTRITCIDMQLFTPVYTTTSIPHTYSMLETFLPSIYTAKCFNDGNLPFSQEVCRTEIGHLFEHILLEYLYKLKSAQGYTQVIYNGETSWNWKKENKGIFHISIDSGAQDDDIFPLALQQTIVLVSKIMENKTPIYPKYISDTQPIHMLKV